MLIQILQKVVFFNEPIVSYISVKQNHGCGWLFSATLLDTEQHVNPSTVRRYFNDGKSVPKEVMNPCSYLKVRNFCGNLISRVGKNSFSWEFNFANFDKTKISINQKLPWIG